MNTIPKELLQTFNSILENAGIKVVITPEGKTEEKTADYETKVATPKKKK